MMTTVTAEEIIKKAKSLGASLAGTTTVEALKKAPSFTVAPKLPVYAGVGVGKDKKEDYKAGEVLWPEGAKSVVVLAYYHPEDKPELDYWYGRISPRGNKCLVSVVDDLLKWIKENYGFEGTHFPYHVERGGIYLKDAAVLAGLGCVGKNNLLVTPEYGPRVRLRALSLPVLLEPTGPRDFDPCQFCGEPCREACQQQAFQKALYCFDVYGREELPGRDGTFDRVVCNIQMGLDEQVEEYETLPGRKELLQVTKYCRRCENSCVVGRGD